MQQSYMDYAMSVIIGRALPDIRDGLKPVQRRVLYAMLSEGLVYSRKTSKCAGVVGEVLKKFHPHGDSSVYDALVRLAQPWNLRYPLVDGQGNFGSVDGDPAAAYRYTECRMTRLSEKLLQDIEKETVDFAPNFDDSTVEPLVLPSMIPNLLVNGADGIAVGMATHMPPHNLTEVINATIAYINNPKISLLELMQIIPGPDFPTGGTICGREPILSAYATGKGVVQLRAKTSIEQLKGKSREIEAIIVTEIPFQVNKARLIERMAELVNGKEIEGIARLRDETDRSGMRIVIELKRDATADVVLSQLYKLTAMQTSFGIINLAISEGRPIICGLTDLISHFVDHRRDVITRRTKFELKKALARMHLLEGFRIALLNLDDVIALIKGSQTPPEAREGLCLRYSLSETQSQAILDLRLQKLTGMERLAIEQEHAELAKEIERLNGILGDNALVDEIIINELGEIRDAFGDARRTVITGDQADINIEDLIEDEEMVVTVSHSGYAKRTSVNEYRAQKRGGKGIAGAAAQEDDFVEHLFVTSTLTYLLVFTSQGKAYAIKVYEIPESGRTARGRALVNLLNLAPEEAVTAILPVREFQEGRSIVMATKAGVVKRVSLMEFARPRRTGLIAISLDDGDRLIGVALSKPSDEIILASRDGMAIRFADSDAREMGRNARGVIGIRVEGQDCVVGMGVVPAEQPEGAQLAAGQSGAHALRTLLTVCENGFGKRTLLSDYRVQGRGGKGLIDIQTDERNGPVVGVYVTNNDSQLMLITSGGKIIRFSASGLSIIGRNTKGVRLINLDEGEKVVAVGQLIESVESQSGGGQVGGIGDPETNGPIQ